MSKSKYSIIQRCAVLGMIEDILSDNYPGVHLKINMRVATGLHTLYYEHRFIEVYTDDKLMDTIQYATSFIRGKLEPIVRDWVRRLHYDIRAVPQECGVLRLEDFL